MSTRHSQEGLEVASHVPAHGHDHPIHLRGPDTLSERNNPQLNNDYYSSSAEKRQLPVVEYAVPQTSDPHNASQGKQKSKRRWIIVAIVLIVIIVAVVGGVVGGLLGSKKNNSSTITTSPGSNSSAIIPANSAGALPASKQASVCRGGICPATLSAISWPSKQFIFGLSGSKSLVYKSKSGGSWDAEWTDLGGAFEYIPAIVSWTEGRIDVMGVGTDKVMSWKSFENNVWNATWTSLGGVFTSAPTAACWGPKRIDLFGRGTDGALWHNYWGEKGVQSWASWESLGGILLGAPSAAAWGDQRLDVFVRGTDQALWHLWYDNTGNYGSVGWHSWESLAGIIVSDPVVVSSAINWLDIFVLGLQNTLCWRAFHNTWLDWQCLGDVLESVPAPLVLGSDRIDVFGLTTTDHVYHRSMVSASWSGSWDDLGGPMNSAPMGLNSSSSQAVVVGVGMDGELYGSNWTSTAFSWLDAASWSSMKGNFGVARL